MLIDSLIKLPSSSQLAGCAWPDYQAETTKSGIPGRQTAGSKVISGEMLSLQNGYGKIQVFGTDFCFVLVLDGLGGHAVLRRVRQP